MKIIRFHTTGGPEVLQFDEVEASKPLGNEVLIKVSAFALNQADMLFIRGQHYTVPNFPSRIGSEATGVVVDIGEGVTSFKKGDWVTSIPFYTQKYGVQGEYATIPERYLTMVPDNFSIEEATSFWMQYLTAYYALFKLGDVQKGDYVFIPATSGTAGQGALKMAKDAGAIVLGSTRTEHKKEYIPELGADHVILSNKGKLLERLKELTGSRGLKFVFDPIGGPFNSEYMQALSFGGSAAIYGLLGGMPTEFPILDLVRNNTRLYAYSMFNYVMDELLLEEGKSYVLDRIRKNGLRPMVDRVFDFKDTVKAYEYMLSNKQKGKIVVKVNA